MKKNIKCFFCGKSLKNGKDDWAYMKGPKGQKIPACKSHQGVEPLQS
jgi:hypothetical protein